MSKLIERAKKFFNKTSEPKEPEAPPVREVPPAPQLIQKGAKYELVKIEEGNKITVIPVDRPEDIALQVEPNCPSCGAKYEGPVGRDCDHCGTALRQVFLRKLEEEVQLDKKTGQPAQSTTEQNLSAPGGLILTEDGYVIGTDATVTRLQNWKITTGNNFTCTETIIGGDITIGMDAEIRRAIIKDYGLARFDHGTHICKLIVGYGVELVFGNDCSVDALWAINLKSIKAGSNFNIGQQQELNRARFEAILSDYEG